ncbi:phosphoserine phosphatase [Hyphomicrobium nitrativorans NL23]|uniref:Phosphoserine phosphatase n=1 Tax=Hyphomicrobium nitrativorans NL23 TaxID=1029756 RepID=V5SE79_9HYPH|nr:phosphoserine phosphatase SerB [Hyphomicrobium nitrativorans]AHB49196.1 phosphoserine phosphatase [Hyphomicrobium nitrativorans NL23]
MSSRLIGTLVLTAAPSSGHLTQGIVDNVRETLSGAGAEGDWLAPGEAWETEIYLDHKEADEVRRSAETALGSAPVDINLVAMPQSARRKRLLCADMESTIISEELIDEMAETVGCRAEIAAITGAAMRGEIDFEGALVQRVALFKGFAANRLDDILRRATLMPGAATLLRTMRANGAKCALVSGGFTCFADPIARRLGFDTVVANELVIENGTLTGEVRPPIVGPNGKADALARLAAKHGLDPSDTLAVGDGANDLVMLQTAGLGVAFRAKPILASAARSSASGAVVAHGDLTALLYLQGIPAIAHVS